VNADNGTCRCPLVNAVRLHTSGICLHARIFSEEGSDFPEDMEASPVWHLGGLLLRSHREDGVGLLTALSGLSRPVHLLGSYTHPVFGFDEDGNVCPSADVHVTVLAGDITEA